MKDLEDFNFSLLHGETKRCHFSFLQQPRQEAFQMSHDRGNRLALIHYNCWKSFELICVVTVLLVKHCGSDDSIATRVSHAFCIHTHVQLKM